MNMIPKTSINIHALALMRMIVMSHLSQRNLHQFLVTAVIIVLITSEWYKLRRIDPNIFSPILF